MIYNVYIITEAGNCITNNYLKQKLKTTYLKTEIININ